MTDVVIRPARPEDAPAVARLGQTTFVETFVEGFGIPYPPAELEPYLESSFGLATTTARMADPAEAWWVAEVDGTVVAFAQTGPNALPHPDGRPSHAELKRLYVARSAQGLGLGTKLLAVALDWMAANGDGAEWIGVWSGNLKAQKLYAAYGFEKAGEYEYPVGSWRDREFILRRG
ncbi:GNAT family N-acetyltransferase [uncultured Brevundimonas sp.]|uniref:GNAT family N-acetyltransferase n=1 Tax=uncultured Brevundimonas sp. TaxID=213418 RepID=UPI0030EDED4E|tara:strand:+ start:1805 stop:2332 length:528 start_codon:yes stop_codon:yes gene_type:complete